MENYVLEIECDWPMPNATDVDHIIARLEDWHVTVSTSQAGFAVLTITLPAEGLRQAVAQGLALVADLATPIVVTALPERVRDAREGWAPMTDLLSVTQAAELLSVSRQRVLQMIAEGKLPSTRVGREYAIPRSAVEARV